MLYDGCRIKQRRILIVLLVRFRQLSLTLFLVSIEAKRYMIWAISSTKLHEKCCSSWIPDRPSVQQCQWNRLLTRHMNEISCIKPQHLNAQNCTRLLTTNVKKLRALIRCTVWLVPSNNLCSFTSQILSDWSHIYSAPQVTDKTYQAKPFNSITQMFCSTSTTQRNKIVHGNDGCNVVDVCEQNTTFSNRCCQKQCSQRFSLLWCDRKRIQKWYDSIGSNGL
jgi:hypothetical protein